MTGHTVIVSLNIDNCNDKFGYCKQNTMKNKHRYVVPVQNCKDEYKTMYSFRFSLLS